MDIQQQIHNKITKAFDPVHFELINESYKHQVPEGAQTHFKAVVVSAVFKGMTRVERHKQVYRLLVEELDGIIKAFSVSTYDPSEWECRSGSAPNTPPCIGGSQTMIT
jgi:BolA protein